MIVANIPDELSRCWNSTQSTSFRRESQWACRRQKCRHDKACWKGKHPFKIAAPWAHYVSITASKTERPCGSFWSTYDLAIELFSVLEGSIWSVALVMIFERIQKVHPCWCNSTWINELWPALQLACGYGETIAVIRLLRWQILEQKANSWAHYRSPVGSIIQRRRSSWWTIYMA